MHLNFSFVHFPNRLNIYSGIFLIWAPGCGTLRPDAVLTRTSQAWRVAE